jgi:hypothetical protein
MNILSHHFGYTSEELAELLYSTNSFISGSVPLNMFIQKRLFNGLDLDIFMRIPFKFSEEPSKTSLNLKCFYPYEKLAKDKFHSSLQSHGYQLVRKNESNKWDSKNLETNDIEYMKCALSHFIKNILTYEKDGRKIQIITLFDCTIEEFMETFDLNICRIVILGKNKELVFYTDHLTTIELKAIQNKEMYIFNPLYRGNLVNRIKKYINRGFVFINTDETFSEQVITYEKFIEKNKARVVPTLEDIKENKNIIQKQMKVIEENELYDSDEE